MKILETLEGLRAVDRHWVVGSAQPAQAEDLVTMQAAYNGRSSKTCKRIHRAAAYALSLGVVVYFLESSGFNKFH